MTVLKYSDIADSGLFVKTSTKGQPNGVADLDSNGKVPTSRLPTTSGGTSSSSTFSFKVNFVSGVISSPSQIENLPTGWTATVSSSIITITHNVASYPKFVSYLGYSESGGVGKLRYRVPTESDDVKINIADLNTKFIFPISSALSAASDSGYALVNISF